MKYLKLLVIAFIVFACKKENEKLEIIGKDDTGQYIFVYNNDIKVEYISDNDTVSVYRLIYPDSYHRYPLDVMETIFGKQKLKFNNTNTSSINVWYYINGYTYVVYFYSWGENPSKILMLYK